MRGLNEAPAMNRVDIAIVFTDKRELEYRFPIDMLHRKIDHFEANGVRYVRARERDWDDVEVTD